MEATPTSPDYLSLTGMLKARPAEEGADRVLYFEASNEMPDLQNERVLSKSLEESAEYFLRYGNLDIDHRTMLPPSVPGENPMLWEIGQPVDARIDGNATFVKAILYQGEGETARNANLVWDSLTKQSPSARWYPSVGGQILGRDTEVDPLTKAKVNLVTKVRWTNIALSRTPVNPSVGAVATIPVGVFAKCCTVTGCFDLGKALSAGYGTDAASLTGGAALRTQSLDGAPQKELPEAALAAIQPQRMAISLVRAFGIDPKQAISFSRQWSRDFSSLLTRTNS